MNVLLCYLMVIGGNVIGLIDQLEKEGFVKCELDLDDCWFFCVLLMDVGCCYFVEMVVEYECWLIEMFDGLGIVNKDVLYVQFGYLCVYFVQCEVELDVCDD